MNNLERETTNALTNIYYFINKLGFKTGNANLKDLNEFISLQNQIYISLRDNRPLSKEIKSQFTKDQLRYITKNRQKIIAPFKTVEKRRRKSERTVRLNQQTGGFPAFLAEGVSFDKIIQNILQRLKSLGVPIDRESIEMMMNRLGFDKKFIDSLANLSEQGFASPQVYLGDALTRLGFDKKYTKLLQPETFTRAIERLGFRGLEEGPEITIKDWVFFPLWSFENLPVVGPIFGGPIDFLSIIIAQLNIFVEFFVGFVQNVRDPIIQSAISAGTVATAGVGLAVAPILIPIVNKLFDLIIHIVGHFPTIINMFIHFSRKNFGLAYVLFCEVVPIFEEFMNTLINFTVIANRALSRTNRVLDNYLMVLTNMERIIYYSNPNNFRQFLEMLLTEEKIEEQQYEREVK